MVVASSRQPRSRSSPSNNNRPASSCLSTTLLLLLGICCLISLSVNLLHGDAFVHHRPDMAIAKAMAEFMEGRSARGAVQGLMKAAEQEMESLENVIEGVAENDDDAKNEEADGNNQEGLEEEEEDDDKETTEDANNGALDNEEEGNDDDKNNSDEQKEGDQENEGETKGEENDDGRTDKYDVENKNDDGKESKDADEHKSDDDSKEIAQEQNEGAQENDEENNGSANDDGKKNEKEKVEEGKGDKANVDKQVQTKDIIEKEAKLDAKGKNRDRNDVAPMERIPSKLGGLNCDKWGGPAEAAAAEMAYWSDIPSDQDYVSPFRAKLGQRTKYMTFEPDGGGWNNIRMAMETVVGLAIAMGRTLVLPPAQGMYLLGKGKKQQNTDFSFAHFFPFHEMAQENSGLEIMTTEEFLKAEAMTGNLIDKVTGKTSFPPYNRTNWDGENVKELKEWLRNVTYIEHMWKPGECLAAFPASVNHEDITELEKLMLETDFKLEQFIGNPANVSGPALQRLHENLSGRTKLCVYDEPMQKQLVVHFMCYHKMRIRYLVHFYAFLYFENWQQDLWMKRFMRDHMRYMDEIQCAAARVVEKVRERSRQKYPEQHGAFDSFHIRRGDFQYTTTRISAQEILKTSKDILHGKKTVFIATDERDKSFFQPLKDVYDVVFLDDYLDVLKDVNSNYYGMIDQLIAAKGDVFFGCWFSTFTGFINRMRGYYSVKLKLPGYENGTLPTTYYYATADKKNEMHVYLPLKGGFFNREFPTSWRQIDTGIGDIQTIQDSR